MLNYNFYVNSDHYLESYKIDKNWIIKKYDRTSQLVKVPYTKHNISVCERQLARQSIEIEKKIKLSRDGKLLATAILMPISILSWFSGLYIFSIYGVFSLAKIVPDLYTDNFHLNDIRLTNFCLQHVDEIKLVKDDIISRSMLSNKAKQVLKNEDFLNYNNSDQYTHNDLKQLKKAIMEKKHG